MKRTPGWLGYALEALLAGLLLTAVPAAARGRAEPADAGTPGAEDGRTKPGPGRSLGIASVPNLRDLGGYRTEDGRVVRSGLLYRSDQLSGISAEDLKRVKALELRNVYDLRTPAEQSLAPDEVPEGARYVRLDVLADASQAGPAKIEKLLKEPSKANAALGGGRVETAFERSYREFVSLPSARQAYRKLFLALGDGQEVPALFHCTTGKDRTGWAAAAFLTLMGVPREQVMADYLRSNAYILPAYQAQIDAFVAGGGDPEITRAVLGVQKGYLEASFDEMDKTYGSIERYFAEGLGIDADRQAGLKALYLREPESAQR